VSVLYEDEVDMLYGCLFLVAFMALNLVQVYWREQRQTHGYILKNIANKEVKKTEQLLMHLMPPHVYQRLKADNQQTDKMKNVTVLYADIVGFTNWSSNKTPTDIVGKLSELFKNFDLLCVKYNVYKVHTIGDCYVVLGINASDIKDRDIG
jgi:phospholipid-translocating ATPase